MKDKRYKGEMNMEIFWFILIYGDVRYLGFESDGWIVDYFYFK